MDEPDLNTLLSESLADGLKEIPDDTKEEASEEENELEAVAEEDSETAETEAVEESGPEVSAAPEHWSAADRELFAKLPPDAQTVLLNKDKEWQKGFQEKAEASAKWDKVFEPYKQALDYRGVTPDVAVKQLLAAQAYLDSNPVDGVLRLAQSYGVLDQIKARFQPSEEAEYIDPEVKQLREKIARLEQGFTSQQYQQANQAQQSIHSQIEAFRNTKDSEGNVKYPHFDKLRPVMAGLVQSGASLEEAYERSKWSLPEVVEAEQKRIKEEAQKQLEADRQKRASEAKKRGRGIKTNGKSEPEDYGKLSIDEQLRAAMRG